MLYLRPLRVLEQRQAWVARVAAARARFADALVVRVTARHALQRLTQHLHSNGDGKRERRAAHHIDRLAAIVNGARARTRTGRAAKERTKHRIAKNCAKQYMNK